MTPSDAAKRKAEELLLSMKSALTNKFTREEAFFIRDQIAAALHIEPGFIRDSEGVDHRIDMHGFDPGNPERAVPLPCFADGTYWMLNEDYYTIDEESGKVVEFFSYDDFPKWTASGWCIEWGDGEIELAKCYSTREAAQHSASERGGGG